MKFQDLLDHFDDRPEIRERIRKNTVKYWPQTNGIYPDIETNTECLSGILKLAFNWYSCDGDPYYWCKIYLELLKLETND